MQSKHGRLWPLSRFCYFLIINSLPKSNIPLPALQPLRSLLSNLPYFMLSSEPFLGQKSHCLHPTRCFPPGFCIKPVRHYFPALCLLSAHPGLCNILVFQCSWFLIRLQHRLKLPPRFNSCDMSKLHYLETVGSDENETGAKWLKQNISTGSYGYALPSGSARWARLTPSARHGLFCVFQPSVMSASGEPGNLMTAIRALKVCLFAYKPILK